MTALDLRPRRRARLSLTSLIDVIFLLLLFFMLSSTFTRLAEVELTAAGAGIPPADAPVRFLSLLPGRLLLNGQAVDLAELAARLTGPQTGAGPQTVLIALGGGVDAQALVDVLAVLRAVPGLHSTVLGE